MLLKESCDAARCDRAHAGAAFVSHCEWVGGEEVLMGCRMEACGALSCVGEGDFSMDGDVVVFDHCSFNHEV